MSEENKATARPWQTIPQGNGSAMVCHEYETGQQMNPKGLRLIAHVLARRDTLKEDEANAALIVRAVNGLGEVEAMRARIVRLEAALTRIATAGYDDWAVTAARAALSRGEG